MFTGIYGMFTGWLRVFRNPGFPQIWDIYGVFMGKYGMFMGKYGMFMGFPGIPNFFSVGNGSECKFPRKNQKKLLGTYSFDFVRPQNSFAPEEQI